MALVLSPQGEPGRPDYLPEGFGTIARPGWQEVLTPEPVPLRPQTVGWAVLLGVVVLGMLILVWRRVRARRANAYRRAALAELAGLRTLAAERGASVLPEVSALLKRTAITAYGRQRVAALSGRAWVEFLARRDPAGKIEGPVTETLVRVIHRGPEGVDDEQAARVCVAAERWIRGHRPEARDAHA